MSSVSTPEKRTSSSSPEMETALFLKVDGDAIYQVQLQRLTRVHLQVEDEIAEYSTSPKPANLSLDMMATTTMEGGDCAVVRFRIFCLQCADDTAEQFLALQSVERALQQVVEENQRQQRQQQLYPSSHYFGAPTVSSSVVTTNNAALMYAPFPCHELAVPSPSALLRDSCSSTEELGQHEQQDLNLASSNDNNNIDTGGGNSNSSASSEQQRLLALLKRRQTARAAAVQKVQGVATLVNFVSTASSMGALLQEEEKEKEGGASTNNNDNASAKTKLRQQTSTLLSGIATDMHMSYCSHAQLCEAAHTLDTKLSEQESRLEAQLLGFFPQRNGKKRARQHGGSAPETSASAGNDNNTTTAAWTEADKEDQIASMKRLLQERKTTLRARHSLALNSCRG